MLHELPGQTTSCRQTLLAVLRQPCLPGPAVSDAFHSLPAPPVATLPLVLNAISEDQAYCICFTTLGYQFASPHVVFS